MALVNISLDTESRQTTLTVNGILVPADEFSISRWIMDGEESLSFSYTLIAENAQGLKETRRFYLPDPSAYASDKVDGESKKVAGLDEETGLVSEVVQAPIQPDDEDIQQDLDKIFKRP